MNRRIVPVLGFVALAASVPLIWSQSDLVEFSDVEVRPASPPVRQVEVVNFPSLQTVEGTVEIGNLPAVQPVTGQVEVTNLSALSGRVVLVGFTSTVYPANSGVFGFSHGCQLEFPDSRVCELQEALRTTDLPDLSNAGASVAWIRQGDLARFDMLLNQPSPVGTINCYGWTSSDDASQGLVLSTNGSFRGIGCNQSAAVACCGPG